MDETGVPSPVALLGTCGLDFAFVIGCLFGVLSPLSSSQSPRKTQLKSAAPQLAAEGFPKPTGSDTLRSASKALGATTERPAMGNSAPRPGSKLLRLRIGKASPLGRLSSHSLALRPFMGKAKPCEADLFSAS